MFITLTIDTKKMRKNFIRLHKTNFNAATGWRRTLHLKKRTIWQRFSDWKKSLKHHAYNLDGQIAMF